MSWSRQTSTLESLMVAALKEQKVLSLPEIVQEILKRNPEAFTGQTPTNSLYSIVYRREKSRIESGKPALFFTEKVRNVVLYSLNPENQEFP
ncbi:MAG: hypothetical protein QM740_13615 [Acidovorax sp.]